MAENQTNEDGKESVDESCDQVVEVCQPMDTRTTCNATGDDDPMPLRHHVSTQCCINARTVVNAETQALIVFLLIPNHHLQISTLI